MTATPRRRPDGDSPDTSRAAPPVDDASVEVAPAEADAPEVLALVAELQQEYVERYGGPDETPVDPDEFRPPDGSFLVLRVDGAAVGCVAIRRHDDASAEMKRLFVRSGWRRQGWASLLLARAEAAAAALGFRRLVLETGLAQPEAVALYTARGYVPTPGFGHYRDSPLNRCFARDLT